MLDFLVTISKKASNLRLDSKYMESLRASQTDESAIDVYENITVYVWHTKVSPFPNLRDQYSSRKNNIRLFQGYTFLESGAPASNIDQISIDNDNIGDCYFLNISRQGIGEICRSKISSFQTYYGGNEYVDVVSSRASLANLALTSYASKQSELDESFARWACSYGVAGNNHSIFSGIYCLELNENLRFSKRGLSVRSSGTSFLMDSRLRDQYATNRKSYWDDAYERMKSVGRVIEMSDAPIEFPLSGGKDSRLLLALIIASGHKKRIERVFTNGPAKSPEVRSARLVCQALGLTHENIDNSGITKTKDIVLSDKLPNHFHVTEGEISPMDLNFTWPRSIRNVTQLHGQEGGLRNIARKSHFQSRDELRKWFYKHLVRGDMCKIFNDSFAQSNMLDVDLFLDDFSSSGLPWSEAPSIHRILYRMNRWVSRTWKAHNEVSFAPYLFVNSEVIPYTINSGYQSRSIEEFHFEMLHRIDKKLIEIPFAGQTWSEEVLVKSQLEIRNPEPFEWDEGIPFAAQRDTNEALQNNICDFTAYIERNAGDVMSQLVDIEKLKRFNKEDLRSGHFQPLWQVLQCTIYENHMSSGIPLSEFGKSLEVLDVRR